MSDLLRPSDHAWLEKCAVPHPVAGVARTRRPASSAGVVPQVGTIRGDENITDVCNGEEARISFFPLRRVDYCWGSGAAVKVLDHWGVEERFACCRTRFYDAPAQPTEWAVSSDRV